MVRPSEWDFTYISSVANSHKSLRFEIFGLILTATLRSYSELHPVLGSYFQRVSSEVPNASSSSEFLYAAGRLLELTSSGLILGTYPTEKSDLVII